MVRVRSSLLQGLERRGLVERRSEPGNERVKRVFATPAGAELIAGFDVAMAAADETILAPLDEAERATLQAVCNVINAGFIGSQHDSLPRRRRDVAGRPRSIDRGLAEGTPERAEAVLEGVDA